MIRNVRGATEDRLRATERQRQDAEARLREIERQKPIGHCRETKQDVEWRFRRVQKSPVVLVRFLRRANPLRSLGTGSVEIKCLTVACEEPTVDWAAPHATGTPTSREHRARVLTKTESAPLTKCPGSAEKVL
jgi:hypothetical protein